MAPGMLHGFLMLPDSIEPAARVRALLAATARRAGADRAALVDSLS